MLLPQQGGIHPRDPAKVLTLSGLTNNTRDVAWEMERVPITAAGLDTGTIAAPEAWEADWHVRHVSPVLPVTPVMATMPSMMTPIMTPAPPMVAPPPGVMLPSCPPGTEKTQIDESPPDNELLQPGRTRGRTRTYHKAVTAARSADHAFYIQRPPNSPPPRSNLPCERVFGARDVPRLWTRSTMQPGCVRSLRSFLGFKGRGVSE